MLKPNFFLFIAVIVGISISVSSSACKSAGSNSSALGSNVAGTPFVMPTRDPNAVKYFESADEISRIKAAFAEKIGGEMKILSFQIVENHAEIQAQDPSKPANVDQYTYRDGKLEAVIPVKLSGSGKLEDNLFKLDDIALDKIPDIIREAMERSKDLENPKPMLARVARNIINGKPEISVVINGTRKNARMVTDGKGKFIQYSTY